MHHFGRFSLLEFSLSKFRIYCGPRRFKRAAVVAIIFSLFSATFALSQKPGDLVKLVHNETEKRYDFETKAMSGSIRAEGPYHGITNLIDKRAGRQVNDERYSVLNLFKLMAVNHGMGTPRHTERVVTATDRSVEIVWEPTEMHQGRITARYEIREPDTIDLHLRLESKGTYAGYELLLPNYFDQEMIPHVYLLRRAIGDKIPETDLVVPRLR